MDDEEYRNAGWRSGLHFDDADRVVIIILSLLCAALGLIRFTMHPIRVVGESMEPTYTEGDIILSTNVDFSPEDIGYDSIIAFRPRSGSRILYIKRVVGLPGDTVEIRDGILYINSRPEDRGFLMDSGSMDAVDVPAGSYFVMGDNRDRSEDSRAFGCVQYENITNLIGSGTVLHVPGFAEKK